MLKRVFYAAKSDSHADSHADSYPHSWSSSHPFVIGLRPLLSLFSLFLLTFYLFTLPTVSWAEEPSNSPHAHPREESTLKHGQEAKEVVSVGILAPYGSAAADEEWGPWIHALNHAFPHKHFALLPLHLGQIQEMADRDELDLLLTHHASFVQLNTKAPLKWIASLKGNVHLSETDAKIGSAIWVNQRSDIQNLLDLKERRISAVGPKALGGFLLAYRLLVEAGLEVNRDLKVEYRGYPIERLFTDLTLGRSEAIIVPACLYERLLRRGMITAGAFRIIHETPNDIGCKSSTELMPSWSLAAFSSIDDAFARDIQAELFRAENGNNGLPSWQLPFTLTEVSRLLQTITFYEEQESLFETLKRLAIAYKTWLFGLFLLFIFMTLNHLWVRHAARKRERQLEAAYHKLHDYERMLAQADRMNILGEMASGIGHELNQPLSTIRNYAEGSAYALKKENPNHTLLSPLEKISDQVSQCHDIIKNLKAWAKPPKVWELEVVNLARFLEQIIEITRLQTNKKVSIVIDVPPEYKIPIVKSVLEQVLTNCLLNSVQAGSTEIRIVAKPYPEYLKLFIVDNGPGFIQEQLESPFVPFRTTKKEGLGLGLVICQRLIANLNGKMRIDNRKDSECGAAVRLILPNDLTKSETAPTYDPAYDPLTASKKRLAKECEEVRKAEKNA